jgi:hypothetical protein
MDKEKKEAKKLIEVVLKNEKCLILGVSFNKNSEGGIAKDSVFFANCSKGALLATLGGTLQTLVENKMFLEEDLDMLIEVVKNKLKK